MTMPEVHVNLAPATSDPADTLIVDHVDVTYRVRGHERLAIRDVSFRVGRGES